MTAKLIRKRPFDGGRKVYGRNGVPSLIVEGNRVMNGEWTIKWLDADNWRGCCEANPSAGYFEYLYHVEGVKGDYRDIFAFVIENHHTISDVKEIQAEIDKSVIARMIKLAYEKSQEAAKPGAVEPSTETPL